MRFNIRLLIVVLTIFTLGIGLFGVLQHQTSTDYILTMELDNLTGQGLMIKDQLDSYLVHTGAIVKQLGLNSEIIEFIRSKEYENTRRIHELLDDIRATNIWEFSVIFLMDETGVCRASTDRRFVGTDYSFRTYFHNLKNDNSDLFISDYAIGLRSLIPGVFLSTPIRNSDGSLAGVVALKIAARYLQDRIDSLSTLTEPIILEEPLGSGMKSIRPVPIPSQQPEVFIINKDGIVIFHTRKHLVYQSLIPLSEEIIAKLNTSQQFLQHTIHSMNDFVLGELHRKSLESREATATIYRDKNQGTWKVLGLVPMNHASWSIGVSLDYTEFRFLSRELLSKTVMILGIIMISLTLASFYITRRITRPITSLMEVISTAKDKNWNQRVVFQHNDEFGYLAQRFNELLEIIESYSKEMEQKVENRTQEVLALQKENTRLRIVEEREQLYSDLHDTIGARLTNINICNNVASNELHSNTAMVENMLNRINMNCGIAIKEMKRLILRNNNLIEGEPVLGEKMVERIRNRLSIRGIILQTRINLPPDKLNGRQSHQIKEILEELVSNVLKHSQAKKVTLSAKILQHEFHLEFSDNGQGFQLQKGETCFGLKNINKRLDYLGGHMQRTSVPGKGVHYSINIPLMKQYRKKQ